MGLLAYQRNNDFSQRFHRRGTTHVGTLHQDWKSLSVHCQPTVIDYVIDFDIFTIPRVGIWGWYASLSPRRGFWSVVCFDGPIRLDNVYGKGKWHTMWLDLCIDFGLKSVFVLTQYLMPSCEQARCTQSTEVMCLIRYRMSTNLLRQASIIIWHVESIVWICVTMCIGLK